MEKGRSFFKIFLIGADKRQTEMSKLSDVAELKTML